MTTNSNIIRNDWPQYDFPQIASFNLLDKAYHIAKNFGMTTHVGNVLSSDVFYSNYFEKNIELGKWGVKAVEMEAADTLLPCGPTPSRCSGYYDYF